MILEFVRFHVRIVGRIELAVRFGRILYTLFCIVDQLGRRFFQVIGQTNFGHQIDESFADVHFGSMFVNRIVPRKSVMVIVMTFAERHKVDVIVVSRIDLVIVRATAEQVSGRIDKPGGVQRSDVLGEHADRGPPDEFAPEIAGNEDGQEQTTEQIQRNIKSAFGQRKKEKKTN